MLSTTKLQTKGHLKRFWDLRVAHHRARLTFPNIFYEKALRN